MNFNQKETYQATSTGSSNDQYEINVSDVEENEEEKGKDKLRKMNSSFQQHQQPKCDQKRGDVYSSLKMTFEQQQAYEATSSGYEVNVSDVEGIEDNEKADILKNFSLHHQQKSTQKRADIYSSLKMNFKQQEAYEATSGYEVNVLDVEGVDERSHHNIGQPPPYQETRPDNGRQDYYNIAFKPLATSTVARTTSTMNRHGGGSRTVAGKYRDGHAVTHSSGGYEVPDTDQ